MSYQFINNGASIRIERDGESTSIGKKSIRDITHIREDLIKIDMGDDCQGIYIRQMDVTAPSVSTAQELIYQLSLWITEAACINCDGAEEETPPMR